VEKVSFLEKERDGLRDEISIVTKTEADLSIKVTQLEQEKMELVETKEALSEKKTSMEAEIEHNKQITAEH